MVNRVEVDVLDKSYTVTPGFRVMEAWEDRVSIHGVAKDLMSGTPKYKDIAWIIYSAVRYGKEDDDPQAVSYNDVGEWVVSNLREAVQACHDLIGAALLAGSEEPRPKKSKPTPEK